MSPLFGLDLHLPSRLKFSLELSANSETDFAVYFGLSQTGKP
jgi:ATP-dependent phosphoenolpyruvate carboxykinase